jgi:hypothetical protein
VRGLRAVINDAMALRNLNELCTMNVPIRSPSSWSRDASWGEVIGFDVGLNRLHLFILFLISHLDPKTVLRLRDPVSSYRECNAPCEVSYLFNLESWGSIG